jgi:hypothetical protein
MIFTQAEVEEQHQYGQEIQEAPVALFFFVEARMHTHTSVPRTLIHSVQVFSTARLIALALVLSRHRLCGTHTTRGQSNEGKAAQRVSWAQPVQVLRTDYGSLEAVVALAPAVATVTLFELDSSWIDVSASVCVSNRGNRR